MESCQEPFESVTISCFIIILQRICTYLKKLISYSNTIRGKILSKNNSTCENAVLQTQYERWTLRVMCSCRVYLGVRTYEGFLCFVTIIFLGWGDCFDLFVVFVSRHL